MASRYVPASHSSYTFVTEAAGGLPTEYPIAVYYRQSTDAQVGNISTAIQTVDMVAYLQTRGWAKEDIHLIDMDAGVSGTTKIDERAGMRMLFGLITDHKIRAVACQDEDRLFRDVTQIQVNIFIEACKNANVQVITPSMVYDFAHPLTGTYHARQFRFKSEMAAEYISSVILGKLNRAKERLLYEGRWAGQNMLPGYMVDMRKMLPDGSPNPNWRRYVEFTPYADVVREYFRLFVSCTGNMAATLRHIHRLGPFYPDPTACPPPEGFKAVYGKIQIFGGGYAPGRSGLENLLSNVNLIGRWTVRNAVVRWNNHPPIVEEKLFWQAFNYLSPVNPDGTPNEAYRPFRQNARPSRDEDRPVSRPLLAGMVVGNADGQWRKVGTIWEKGREEYTYVLANQRDAKIYWRRKATYIDEAVTNLVQNKLRATFSPEVWERALAQATGEFQQEHNRITAQLNHLKSVMHNHIVSLETLSNADLIRAVQTRYQDAQAEFERLSHDLAATNKISRQIDALEDIRHSIAPTLAQWNRLSRDEKRQILHTFIKRIEANVVDGTGLEVKVFWLDETTDALVVRRSAHNGWTLWLDSEAKNLMDLLDHNAGQLDIAAAFPRRKWRMIAAKIYDLRGSQYYVPSPRPIYHHETYEDYLSRTGSHDAPYLAYSGDHWNEESLQTLLALYDKGVSRRELMEAFPHRRWRNLTKKIRQLRGEDRTAPDPRIGQKDTYCTLLERESGELDQANHAVLFSTGFDSGSSMPPLTPSCWR